MQLGWGLGKENHGENRQSSSYCPRKPQTPSGQSWRGRGGGARWHSALLASSPQLCPALDEAAEGEAAYCSMEQHAAYPPALPQPFSTIVPVSRVEGEVLFEGATGLEQDAASPPPPALSRLGELVEGWEFGGGGHELRSICNF